jgi:hypothetical protein
MTDTPVSASTTLAVPPGSMYVTLTITKLASFPGQRVVKYAYE